jgi:hypothetical protein
MGREMARPTRFEHRPTAHLFHSCIGLTSDGVRPRGNAGAEVRTNGSAGGRGHFSSIEDRLSKIDSKI